MKHPVSVSFTLIALFLASQLVGLFVVNAYVNPEESGIASEEAGFPVMVYDELPLGFERPELSQETSFVFISLAVAAGTVLLLIVVRLRKVSLWKFWFLIASVLALGIAFSAFIHSLAAFGLAAALSFIRVFRPNVIAHNLSELFVYGGIAAIFVPVLNVFSAAILLVIISAYDFVAVFLSKHMISLAKFQTENSSFAGLFIPRKLSLRDAAAPPAVKKSKAAYSDSGSYAVIGGGDMAFPLLFAGVVSAQFGIHKALIIPAFAALALSVLFVVSRKGKFYPAMPSIAAGCFLGYGIVNFLL